MLNKITSEYVCILSFLIVIGLGFARAYISSFPAEITTGGIVSITLGFFGKRLIQKKKGFGGHDEDN